MANPGNMGSGMQRLNHTGPAFPTSEVYVPLEFWIVRVNGFDINRLESEAQNFLPTGKQLKLRVVGDRGNLVKVVGNDSQLTLILVIFLYLDAPSVRPYCKAFREVGNRQIPYLKLQLIQNDFSARFVMFVGGTEMKKIWGHPADKDLTSRHYLRNTGYGLSGGRGDIDVVMVALSNEFRSRERIYGILFRNPRDVAEVLDGHGRLGAGRLIAHTLKANILEEDQSWDIKEYFDKYATLKKSYRVDPIYGPK